MNKISYIDVTQAVEAVKNQYLINNRASSPMEINNGLCVEFGEDVMKQLNIELEGDGFYLWDIDNFRDFETEMWYSESMQTELKTSPPLNMSWEEINKIPFGHHRWITYKDKHYDAECSEGVNNLFHLPFFKRYIDIYNQ